LDIRQAKFELPEGKKALPLHNEEHAVVLFHLAHQKHRPQHNFPGFRLLGAFPNVPLMREFISRHYDTERDACSLWCSATHQLVPITISTSNQKNDDYCRRQVQTVLKLYEQAQKDADTEFKCKLDNKAPEEKHSSVYARQRASAQVERKPSAEMLQLPKTSVLSQSVAIMGQKFAVVIVLRDIREAVLANISQPEPLFCCLDVFENLEDATFYAKYTASAQYPSNSIDIMDMYQWVFPENVDPDEIKEVYANKKLDDIMAGRKDTTRNAKKYEEWCEKHGHKPEVSDLSKQEEGIED
jgi:RNAse (barnase) inhibitor barstar